MIKLVSESLPWLNPQIRALDLIKQSRLTVKTFCYYSCQPYFFIPNHFKNKWSNLIFVSTVMQHFSRRHHLWRGSLVDEEKTAELKVKIWCENESDIFKLFLKIFMLAKTEDRKKKTSRSAVTSCVYSQNKTILNMIIRNTEKIMNGNMYKHKQREKQTTGQTNKFSTLQRFQALGWWSRAGRCWAWGMFQMTSNSKEKK